MASSLGISERWFACARGRRGVAGTRHGWGFRARGRQEWAWREWSGVVLGRDGQE
jgi:hypothetical protein